MLSVKVVKNSLPQIIRQFPEAADRLLMNSVHRLHSYALSEAPYKTGTLMRGHYVLKVSGGWQLKVKDVPHAPMVYYGTRPHIIRAKRPNGFLAFPGRNGQMVYRRSVYHPGTKPNKWLDRAVAREKPHFQNDVKRLAEYIEHL